MSRNSKVFISHAHEDNDRCIPLLAALDAWGVNYWFDRERLDAGHDLSQRIQEAIIERDTLIRVCTPASQSSYWVQLETNAFRGLQAKDYQAGDAQKRVLINLILDSDYAPEPFDFAHVFINAAGRPQREWLSELGRALQGDGQSIASASARDHAGRSKALVGQLDSILEQLKSLQGKAKAAPTSAKSGETPDGMKPGIQTHTIPRLVVRQGNDVGRVFTLHAASMAIGTSPTVPVQLHDERVNPIHAFITRSPTGIRQIRDNGSKTGTFVNEHLIDARCVLKEGDVIRLGESVLLFTYM